MGAKANAPPLLPPLDTFSLRPMVSLPMGPRWGIHSYNCTGYGQGTGQISGGLT
jgi:hypothetical protein